MHDHVRTMFTRDARWPLGHARWPLGLRVLYGCLRYVRKVTKVVNIASFFCYFFEFVRKLISCDLVTCYIILLIIYHYHPSVLVYCSLVRYTSCTNRSYGSTGSSSYPRLPLFPCWLFSLSLVPFSTSNKFPKATWQTLSVSGL